MNTITFDEAVASIREQALEVRADETWAISLNALDIMTDVMIAFLMDDDGGYLSNYGIPSVHSAMNAYHYYSTYSPIPSLHDAVVSRVIAGCESYMREGWDDYFDLIDTAKALAVFTWADRSL